MEISGNEIGDRTVWKKYLSYVKADDSIFGLDAKFAKVVCVREVSGYAVWYMRYLEESAEVSDSKNGTYLLKFFKPAAKFEAIEFAVKMAGLDEEAATVIAGLDRLSQESLRIEDRQQAIGPFERID